MDDHNIFKVPENIPQDLLLIHDLVGDIPIVKQNGDDSIDSSDDDASSEIEVEADLLVKIDEDEDEPVPGSSDSDSDPDSSDDEESVAPAKHEESDGDDEDSGPAPTTGSYFLTKNELPEEQINVPDIEKVGPNEHLEKVGEIMSVINKVVIVKGLPTEVAGRASERALDSDTLLVLGDRKVLGYIFETFGPTSQPLYQVKFNATYPIDPEKVQVSREVFHVPQRSNFIFLRQIRLLKGSDASNVHDEEPAEDEVEFSDDEQEAAFKSARKRERSQSVSRAPTPRLRDQDMLDSVPYGTNPYDEHGPYDMDFSAGPSRPPPIPYDDPYSDNVSYEPRSGDGEVEEREKRVYASTRGNLIGSSRGRRRDRRDRPERGDGGRSRGRGRGRDARRGSDGWGGRRHEQQSNYPDSYTPAPTSPTSRTIAHATGQYSEESNQSVPANTAPFDSGGGWGYQQPYPQTYPQLNFGAQQYVQPHINPRFASAFGMNLMPPQPYGSYEPYGSQQPGWTSEWTGHQPAPPADGRQQNGS